MPASLRTARWTFAVALAVLVAAEMLRIYWIMPFPGSQRSATIGLAYGLHRWIWPLRVLVGAVAVWAAGRLLVGGGWSVRALTLAGAGLFGVVAYQANFPMSADVMFRQPEVLAFAPPAAATLPAEALVVGIELSGAGGAVQARAYPLRFIGYHHQVRDVVAGQPVMVTYCTVCRTGRVYRPVVNGEVADFRLVGMDHWNAMFEDSLTGSWWRQANGKAIAGSAKGQQLVEIPSHQMTWAAWSSLHPGSDVMEPDPRFLSSYTGLEAFEQGTSESTLTGRDTASWGEKSWVVGVLAGGQARAFDWNELVRARVIEDSVGGVPVVLLLGADGASFHAFDARPDAGGTTVSLEPTAEPDRFRDRATGALWHESGVALGGPQAGKQLKRLPAYQEFWHSWRTFHPQTTAGGSAAPRGQAAIQEQGQVAPGG